MIKSKLKTAFQGLRLFFRENPLGFPLLLLGLTLVTYGIFISALGFYWDDWPPLVFSHMADKSAVLQYFSYDRPIQSWTYYVLLPICRDSSFAWQLSVILFRWTSALALYCTFVLVLPKQRHLLQWAAVLFMVFPGFSDQYASVAFSSHFLTYTVFGLSLLTMVLALRDRKRFWIFFPLSILLTAVDIFTMEYFVGLEALRPILLFLVLSVPEQKNSKTFVKMLKYWLPYLAVLGIYTYWRMVLYPAAMGGDTGDNYPYLFQDLLKTPVETLGTLAQSVYGDLRFMLLGAWTDRLLPLDLMLQRPTAWGAVVIGILVAVILVMLIFREEDQDFFGSGNKRAWSNIFLGLWIIIVAMLPIWSTLRSSLSGKWSNRFEISAIWGVALVVATLILALFRNTRVRQGLLIVLVGLSIGYQIRIGNDYRNDFARQQNFYTQLSWRIPSLQTGTALYLPSVPTSKEADYSYTFGINLLYSGDGIGFLAGYWLTGPRYYNVNDLTANPTLQIQGELRTFKFSTPASNVVSIHIPDTGCLWVVDEYYSLIQGTAIENLPAYGKLTNQDLIKDENTGINGLANIFDFNAQNGWCYYFEKGDLAQSKGQWKRAVSYYEQAMAEGIVPAEGIEYLPFIKAYAEMGSIEKAKSLTSLAYAKSRNTRPSICQYWHDLLDRLPDLSSYSIDDVYNSIDCPSFFVSG